MKNRFLLGVTWLFLGLASARSAEIKDAFEQANKLYERGKYAEAAAAYGALVAGGKVSAPLYFNYANSLFKSGQIGRAIIQYQLAERLAPRDPDIRANLRFARDSVTGSGALRRTRWQEWLQFFTLNELTVIAASAAWIWFALLILRQLRAEWAKHLKGYTSTAGVVTLLLAAWLSVAAYTRLEKQVAVVVVPEAVVRYGPLEESQSYFTARDGAELAILDRKEGWLQVRDGAGRIGWLRSEQTATVAPAPNMDRS